MTNEQRRKEQEAFGKYFSDYGLYLSTVTPHDAFWAVWLARASSGVSVPIAEIEYAIKGLRMFQGDRCASDSEWDEVQKHIDTLRSLLPEDSAK